MSLALGKDEIGEQRKQLYDEAAAKRGYTLSAFVIKVMDKEFGVKLPPPRYRRPSKKALTA